MNPIQYNSNQKYYFLSDNDNLNNEKIYPRVPKRRMRGENCIDRRICIAPTFYSSLKALPLKTGMIFTIYEVQITSKNKIVIPEDKDVLDAKYTREHWCLNPVVLHKKGKIKIISFEPQNYKYTIYGSSFTTDVNKNIKFSWIEKIF